MDRREFLLSAGAATAFAGCRMQDVMRKPALCFGVVSDLHLTTPKSCRMFELALRQFRHRGVDAVVIPGDLTDWGLRSGFVCVKRVWNKVFAGTGVVPLFCTGNHDYEGWRYPDMAMEMRANGYSESENLADLGMGREWESVFGEPFDIVRCRRVKGYDFISTECVKSASGELASWLTKNSDSLSRDRPFFYFRHGPIAGTTIDGLGDPDVETKGILAKFPNCIAITGHMHRPFVDERQIWQGEFTAVGAPSLSYACFPPGHENGEGPRDGESRQAMPILPSRRDLRGGQGFVVSVWPDEVVFERRDFEADEEGAPAWVIPLPLGKAVQPYADGVRGNAEPVPAFPRGAELDIETRNTENRSGRWTIVLNCEFPSADMPSGHRVFDYEIRVVPKDGSKPFVRRFLSPAYPKLARCEPKRQRFWLDVSELPQGRDCVVEVRAFNCFGRGSLPLVSSVYRSTALGGDLAGRGNSGVLRLKLFKQT